MVDVMAGSPESRGLVFCPEAHNCLRREQLIAAKRCTMDRSEARLQIVCLSQRRIHSGAYFVRTFIHPPIPSASMNRPPKSGVVSIRPVLEYVTRTAVKLSAAARKASQTVTVCIRDGGFDTVTG
jgi:hypothetical protein